MPMPTTVPATINGFPVRDHIERDRFGTHYVLVERPGHSVHPWVVATWHPNCGDSWWQGDYYATRDEARWKLLIKAARATRVSLH